MASRSPDLLPHHGASQVDLSQFRKVDVQGIGPGDAIVLYNSGVPEAEEPVMDVGGNEAPLIGEISPQTRQIVKDLITGHGEAIRNAASGEGPDDFGTERSEQEALHAAISGLRRDRAGRGAFGNMVREIVASNATKGVYDPPQDSDAFSNVIQGYVQDQADRFYDEFGVRFDSKPILIRGQNKISDVA